MNTGVYVRRRSSWLLPLFLFGLAGCDALSLGTSVGNPNLTVLMLADPGTEVDLDEAVASLGSFVVDGEEREISPNMDLLQGIPLDIPRGTIDSLQVVFDEDVVVTGTEGDARLDLVLDVGGVEVMTSRDPLTIDEPHVFRLAFDGWLDSSVVGWTRGEDHTVRPGDAIHDTLVEAIQRDSALIPGVVP